MKLKILTVDDSNTIRTIIKKTLSKFDCELIEASNGAEGLDAAKKEDPNLIILDIDMPGMNGLEVLMNLRNDDKFMNTPVFMLTSKSKTTNVRIALELGVAAFISKPFKRADLINRIKKVLPLAPA
jgi:DNA-binding response OmpR family regulator